VFDAFRDDEHFARRQMYGTVTKINPQNDLSDDECFIRILVVVPNENLPPTSLS
jgi:hypothetical protein